MLYRVVQKNGYPVLFWDNFGNSAPILTILSLLQAEIYGDHPLLFCPYQTIYSKSYYW